MDVKIYPLVVGTIIAMAKVDAGKLHPWKRLGVAGGFMPLAAPSRGFGLGGLFTTTSERRDHHLGMKR